ncbi:MAG: dihydrofolate reductase [Pirellulales bacterium]
MRLSLIVAHAPNRVIGNAGGLPWRLSSDLKRFKSLTMGHHLIMGRKTYDSIGKPLPGRTSIVLTRTLPQAQGETNSGVLYATTLTDAIRLASGDDEAFVIGGGDIYRQALPLVDRLYLTLVDADVDGDTYFPAIELAEWKQSHQESCPAAEKDQFPHQFLILDRVAGKANST